MKLRVLEFLTTRRQPAATDERLFAVPPQRADGSRDVVCPVTEPVSTSTPVSARLGSAVAGTAAMPGCAHVCAVVCSANVSHTDNTSNTRETRRR